MKFQQSLLFMLLVLFQSCGNQAEPKTETTKPMTTETEELEEVTVKKRIVFFGNSITAGYQLSEEEAFPALIKQRLDSLELEYEVQNAGLSGETTAGGVERVDWILKGDIDIFVLELGANDGLRGLPLTETEKNLGQIIEKVRTEHPKARILLLGMEVPPNMGDDYAAEFREVFRRVAENHNVELLPFLLKGVAGIQELNLPDGIHPTPKGHRILSHTVWEALQPLL